MTDSRSGLDFSRFSSHDQIWFQLRVLRGTKSERVGDRWLVRRLRSRGQFRSAAFVPGDLPIGSSVVDSNIRA